MSEEGGWDLHCVPERNADISKLPTRLLVPGGDVLVLRVRLPHHVVHSVKVEGRRRVVLAKARVSDVVARLNVELEV